MHLLVYDLVWYWLPVLISPFKNTYTFARSWSVYTRITQTKNKKIISIREADTMILNSDYWILNSGAAHWVAGGTCFSVVQKNTFVTTRLIRCNLTSLYIIFIIIASLHIYWRFLAPLFYIIFYFSLIIFLDIFCTILK